MESLGSSGTALVHGWCRRWVEGQAGQAGGPWGPHPHALCLTYLQLIEVICAILPRQTLHDAWHW